MVTRPHGRRLRVENGEQEKEGRESGKRRRGEEKDERDRKEGRRERDLIGYQ